MDLFGLLITLVILGLIFAVLWWGVQQLTPKMPAPFGTVIQVIFVLAVVIVLVSLLLGHIPVVKLPR
jgi:hypothetical protein